MLQYKFIKWQPFKNSGESVEISVNPPYEILGQIFVGSELISYVQDMMMPLKSKGR